MAEDTKKHPVRVTLVDGTTLEGKVVFSWRWWTMRLVGVTVHGRTGPIEAAGYFVLPKRNILFIQVGE